MHFIQLPYEDIDKLSQLAKEKHCAYLLNVYVALLYHADKKGKCFPGYEKIMKISGIGSKSSISRALIILEEQGFIKKKSTHGRHGSNSYYLPKVQEMNFKSPGGVRLKSTKQTLKVQEMDSKSPRGVRELYPYNYNHLTISHLTKEREHIPFKEREEWEKKIKEVVGEIINREITPLEERLLEEILLYTPGEKLLGALEDFYLHNPETFKEQGLFILEGGSGS